MERLYGGLTHATPWEDFLRALADATGATFATLIIGRSQASVDAHVTPGVDPGRAQEYSRLSQSDPFVGLPEGQVVSFRDFVRHVPARFRDWMDLARTGQVLGVDLHRPPDAYVRLRLTRDDERADFGEAQRHLIGRLVPHLRIALELHARLTTTQAESRLFSSAMADLAVASLILNRDGRILRRNAIAARMLEEGGVIAESAGKLAPRTGAGAAAIARILADPPRGDAEILFEMAGADGAVALLARARGVPSSAYGDGAWLALFLTDPARPDAFTAEMLRGRFQLTRAEAALARHLLAGASLADAAETLAIAYNTARSHLRSIFAKTGTHRQGELVALLRSAGRAMDV